MRRHGTSSSYTSGCRCQPCRDAHNSDCQRRRKLIAHGRWEGLVDDEPTRRRLLELRDAGMTWRQITERSGIAQAPLYKVLTGRYGTTVTAATERAILGTHPTTTAPEAPVDAVGTRRRLQALQLAGWTIPQIGAHSGVDLKSLREVSRGRRHVIRARTRDAVTAATRVLDRQTPPDDKANKAATRYATTNSWVDLAAWDDADDPAEKPKGIPGEGAPQGPPRVEAEVIATIHRLRRAGLTDRAIADHLGYATTSAIQKLRHRHREDAA